MTDLSPALRPWTPWLAPLVPDLAVGLGPLVERLAHTLGPMPPRPEPGAVEPNGLSGLDRRGPYERLLLTEWALADELPDEFLRRAASHEHLFLQIERESPQGGRRCVVLFDAGPDQVGGPRLAHLALLAVFARRAEEARATLVFGAIQLPGQETLEVTGQSFVSLLAARSAQRPSVADHRQWAEALGLDDRDEVWVVGGAEAVRGAPGQAAHVCVREVLHAGPDELEVEVRRPGRPARTVRLPLPSPDVRARLIRQPLRPSEATQPAPLRRSRPRAHGTWGELRPELRFSADGHRLLCREVGGHVVAFRAPNQPDAWRKPRRVQVHEPRDLFALGWAHRNVVLLRRTPDGGAVLEGGRFAHTWSGPQLPLPPAPLELVATRGVSPISGARAADIVWFRDTDRRLWCWPMGEAPVATPGGLAVGRRDGRELLVRAEGDQTRVIRGSPERGTSLEVQVPFAGLRAHIGSGGGAWIGTVFVEGRDRWAFAPRTPTETALVLLPAVPDATVVGVWGDWRARGVVYLRRGVLCSRSLEPLGEPVVLPARDAVVAADCSPMHYSRLVAWMETSGRIVFYDLEAGERQVLDPTEAA